MSKEYLPASLWATWNELIGAPIYTIRFFWRATRYSHEKKRLFPLPVKGIMPKTPDTPEAVMENETQEEHQSQKDTMDTRMLYTSAPSTADLECYRQTTGPSRCPPHPPARQSAGCS